MYFSSQTLYFLSLKVYLGHFYTFCVSIIVGLFVYLLENMEYNYKAVLVTLSSDSVVIITSEPVDWFFFFSLFGSSFPAFYIFGNLQLDARHCVFYFAFKKIFNLLGLYSGMLLSHLEIVSLPRLDSLGIPSTAFSLELIWPCR